MFSVDVGFDGFGGGLGQFLVGGMPEDALIAALVVQSGMGDGVLHRILCNVGCPVQHVVLVSGFLLPAGDVSGFFDEFPGETVDSLLDRYEGVGVFSIGIGLGGDVVGVFVLAYLVGVALEAVLLRVFLYLVLDGFLLIGLIPVFEDFKVFCRIRIVNSNRAAPVFIRLGIVGIVFFCLAVPYSPDLDLQRRVLFLLCLLCLLFLLCLFVLFCLQGASRFYPGKDFASEVQGWLFCFRGRFRPDFWFQSVILCCQSFFFFV